jgi:HD superfamily phosphodiesterase
MTKEKLEEVKQWAKKRIENIQDPQHGWDHLQRVANNAQKIVKSLKLESEVDMNLLQAVCYLHDMNPINYSPGFLSYFLENKRIKLVLPKALSELEIENSEREIIQRAIYSGSFSFPFKKLNKNGDLYTKILQDADTIDFFSKEREQGFKKAGKKFVFYAFLGIFSNWALNYGRKNLKNYLNLPQLIEKFYVQKG